MLCQQLARSHPTHRIWVHDSAPLALITLTISDTATISMTVTVIVITVVSIITAIVPVSQ